MLVGVISSIGQLTGLGANPRPAIRVKNTGGVC